MFILAVLNHYILLISLLPVLTYAQPSTKTLPFSCSFESESNCGYTQRTDDQLDWIRRTGGTPTANSGPSGAFDGQFYMFFEASGPRVGHRAIFESPTINFAGRACLAFYYHMYGETIGSLSVYSTNRGLNNPYITITGEQGNRWILTRVTLELFGSRFGFIGVRGTDVFGDIAIDNAQLTEGSCTGSTQTPFVCTFETDFCGMTQRTNDEFDWLGQYGPTATRDTGPTGASGGSLYIYTEASDQAQNDRAIISTPPLQLSGSVCLIFYYHMYDASQSAMGTLNVYKSTNEVSPIFARSGNQGNQWVEARIDIDLNKNEQILFEGIRGSNVQSDIAIDEVQVHPGQCSQTPTTTASPTTQPPDTVPVKSGLIFGVYSCNTEGDGSSFRNCRLRQDTADNLEFTLQGGRTPSGLQYRRINGNQFPVTGPQNAREGSRYIFIEATGRSNGDVARLFVEGTDTQRTGNNCLRFFYTMNGYHTGTLTVFTVQNGQRRKNWFLQGDQLQDWHEAAVNLDLTGVSQIGIEATTNGEFSGDTALDSLSLNTGRCEIIPSGYVWACNFETPEGAATYCGIQQDTNDSLNFDWEIRQGQTPSDYTGPPGASSGQWYIYAEASKPRQPNDFARFLLPNLGGSGTYCLEFNYNLYGFHIRRLGVFGQLNSIDRNLGITVEGNQGPNWMQRRSAISLNFGEQIGFTAVRGDEFSGDIALDNIRVRTGNC